MSICMHEHRGEEVARKAREEDERGHHREEGGGHYLSALPLNRSREREEEEGFEAPGRPIPDGTATPPK